MTRNAIAASVFALLTAGAAAPATLRSLVNEGNERYEGKEYQEAVKNYRLAAEQSPESPHAHFNLGAALYRTGEYPQAVTAFQHAAQMAREAGDVQAEGLSRYNLGNAFFRSSEADARTNPREAIGALESAVETYRQALQLDPGLGDARHNIAIARRRMKELLDQMRDMPAGGQSQDDQEQLQQDIQENLDRQNELSRRREELEQRQQDPQEQEKAREQAQELARQQQELEQRSREMSEQLDRPNATPQQQKAQEQLEQAAQQQQSASEQLEKGQLEQAQGSQQQARQRLEEALTSLGGKPAESGEQRPQNASGAPPQQQAPRQSLQALEQSPQDILNEERANRQRRRMLMLGAQAQVEKDW